MEEIKELEKRVKKLEEQFKSQYEVMQEAVMTARNPMGMYSRFERFESSIDQIIKTITKINADMLSLMTSAKYVELFSNEELKNYYMNTDKTLKELEMLLRTHFPDYAFTTTNIQKYVNGDCPDVHIRSFLGKYLRNEANTKAQKAKLPVTNTK